METRRRLSVFAAVWITALSLAPATFAQSRDINVLSADQIWEGVQSGSKAGAWLDQGALRARTFAQDHRRDLIIGAPGGPGIVGQVHVIYGGPVRTGTITLATADATITGAALGDLFGTSTAAGNIISVEGVEPKNLVVGAPGANGGKGVVYLFAGSFAQGQQLTTADAVMTIVGAPGDQLGAMLATADLNNDGHREIIIGAPGNSKVY